MVIFMLVCAFPKPSNSFKALVLISYYCTGMRKGLKISLLPGYHPTVRRRAEASTFEGSSSAARRLSKSAGSCTLGKRGFILV